MDELLKFLKKIAQNAGELILSYQNKPNKIEIKPGQGYVGEADYASEQFIIEQINKEYPHSKIISEEKGVLNDRSEQSDLTWIIDPIDGTTNFIHGFPFYAVSIGVMQNEEIIAGTVLNPALNELYWASKGKGAYLNNEPIYVSNNTSFKDSLLITGFYYHQGLRLEKQMQRFQNVQKITQSVRRLGSAALDVCYVACGKADGFWEEGLSCWDIAGATIVLKESGGNFTDFSNGHGSVFGSEFVFSNGKIHNDLLKVIT